MPRRTAALDRGTATRAGVPSFSTTLHRAPGPRPGRRRRPRTIRRVDGHSRNAPAARHRCMERKKIFRSVWFWVALVVVVALGFSVLSRGNGGYQQVKTSVALEQFSSGNVSSAIINDKEQTLDLTLKNAVEGSTKISSSY